MIILIAIAFGVLSVLNIDLDMMPNMNLPYAAVITTYTGAAPEEIETLVTKPLEGSLGQISGLKTLMSSSSYGSSMVVMEFNDSVNIDNTVIDVLQQVDAVKGRLPDDCSDPMVFKIDMNNMINFTVGLSSENSDSVTLKRLADNKIKDELEKLDGVASVSVSGGRDEEISVTLNMEAMRGYGISESQVQQALSAENSNTPLGSVKQGRRTLTMRVFGQYEALSDIENIPFATPAGARVYLRDFASVNKTLKDASSVSYINGTPSVTLNVSKQSTSNVVKMSDNVLKELKKLEKANPDIKVTVLLDPAQYIRRSLSQVMNSAIQGSILAIVVLYIFLRNLRSTLIVAAAIPISIISTFVLMYYTGMTLNMMSLGGLSLGIGMLVDNSIVVLESVYRKLDEGIEAKTAAIEGTREVATSVIASTLTTVAVFLPITFSGGLSAQIFNQLALTISFSLGSSLLVSMTFVPMACSVILKPGDLSARGNKSGVFSRFLDKIGDGIEGLENFYRSRLDFSLKHRKFTILVVIALTVLTFLTVPTVGMEFMPTMDQNQVGIDITLPKGSLLKETEDITNQTLAKIEGKFPEIKEQAISIGGGGSMFGGASENTASVTLNLIDKSEREKSTNDIASEINKLTSDVPGAKIKASSQGSAMGSYGGGSSADYQIFGDDLEELETIADDFKEMLSGIEGVTNVTTSLEDSTPQATVRVDRAKAAGYGVSPSSVAGIVRTAISGSVPTSFKEGSSEYDIRVRQDQNKFDYITDVETILVPLPRGGSVPLTEIADVEVDEMPATIGRYQNQRYVEISASIASGTTSGSVNKAFAAAAAAYYMPDGYTWETSGSLQQMSDTFGSLGLALIMAVVIVYMIMAAEFENLRYPFIVMFSIPIAMTGGIFGLFVTRQTLSIASFLGLIMLAGIVVNNAIVLIDYTNLLIRERGMAVTEALLEAGPVRMRPILMSVATTALGLFPMMLSNQTGSEMMKGLSSVVVFGLLISTLVTLLFVPVIYLSMHNATEKRKAKKAARG
jgi:HAE1 family hydrophobic/amphiphilic exporter-1